MSATVPTEPGVEALEFTNRSPFQPGDVASLDSARSRARRSARRWAADDAAPLPPPGDRQPRRGRDAGDPRGPRAQRAARRADPRHRALHRARAPRAVRPPGRRALRRPAWRRRRPQRYLDYEALERALRRDARRRGLGRLGLRRRAPGVRRAVRAARASSSSGPTPTSCARSATRSRPSGSPSRPACRSRPGAAARSRPSRRRARHAERIGFPLMIKAAAGGGGRGMRRVDAPDELPTAFARARAEAEQAFGDARVLMEQPRRRRRATSRCS